MRPESPRRLRTSLRSFSYEPVTHAPPSPPAAASPTPPSPGGVPLATGTRSAAALSPADAVHALAAYILNDTADVSEFQRWGYGQSIILDAMMLASERVSWAEVTPPRVLAPTESCSYPGFLACTFPDETGRAMAFACIAVFF